jgi:hypothetical protein
VSEQTCGKCGTVLNPDARFCMKCGTPVPQLASVEPPPAGPQGPPAAPYFTQQGPPPQVPFLTPPPKRPGWWGRRSGLQKVGMIVGAVIVVIAVIAGVVGGRGYGTTTLSPVPTTTQAQAAVATESTTTTTQPPTTTTEAMTTTERPTTTTTQAVESGTRENPTPMGQEAQVGNWRVKVIGATPKATQAVLDANMFNDKPQSGYQYVLVKITATYTGDESATFWVDMSSKFVGKGGNTFDSGMVVAPNSISDAGEVFSGASVSGNLVFAVASDQVSGGSLSLEQSFSFDETRVFFAIQ